MRGAPGRDRQTAAAAADHASRVSDCAMCYTVLLPQVKANLKQIAAALFYCERTHRPTARTLKIQRLALLAYWSVRQKLNRVSSVQLRCSARFFTVSCQVEI